MSCVLASNVAGGALAFIVSLYVRDKAGFTTLLWAEAIGSLALLALGLGGACWFGRDEPKLPPSASAAAMGSHKHAPVDVTQMSPMDVLWRSKRDYIALCRNRRFMTLVVVMGMSQGCYTSWSGVAVPLLKPLGYSQEQANWIGFASQMGCLLGVLLVGGLSDYCQVAKHGMKRWCLALLGMATTLFVLFALMTTTNLEVVPRSVAAIATTITFASAVVMGSESIFYEECVESCFGEISSDTGEASVGAFICLVFNGFGTVFLIFSSVGVSAPALTWILAAACGVSLLLLFTYEGDSGRRKRNAME